MLKEPSLNGVLLRGSDNQNLWLQYLQCSQTKESYIYLLTDNKKYHHFLPLKHRQLVNNPRPNRRCAMGSNFGPLAELLNLIVERINDTEIYPPPQQRADHYFINSVAKPYKCQQIDNPVNNTDHVLCIKQRPYITLYG